MTGRGLHEFLTVGELAEHLRCDERSARAVAREVGYVTIARRMLVRRDWLDRWEEGQRRSAPAEALAVPPRRRRARPVQDDLRNLPEGWWRRTGDGA